MHTVPGYNKKSTSRKTKTGTTTGKEIVRHGGRKKAQATPAAEAAAEDE